MATVSFKKGLLANLPSTYSEGTLYITTDERSMYLDVSDSARIRIGDFQEFATLTELQQNINPSTTALYYVADMNVLAKWNGTGYVQINLDTGATSVEVTGDGNALVNPVYDPQTRKLTFTATTLATPEDVADAIDAAIGDLGNDGEGSPYANVKDYVDDKVADVVAGSISGLGDLASKDKVAEADLDTTLAAKLNGKADIGTDSDASSVDSVKGAKKYTDEKVAAVEAKIGTVTEGKTVVQMISEAQEAATYDDTELSGRVTAVEGEVDTLIGTDTGKSVRTIANEELAAQLIPESAQESLDTLAEIAAWIQEHPNDAAAMNAAIEALQSILDGIGDTESGEKATVVAYVTDAIAALNIGDLTGRVATLEGTSHTHTNKTELDKIVDGDKAKWDSAEQNAKDYADSLAVNYDAAGSADAAETAAKAYADGLAVNYDAAGSADAAEAAANEYTDTALTWGSF